MPRAPRLDYPGVPQHVVARGNNRVDIFRSDFDRTAYLRYLRESATNCRCDLHSFVLMSNHVHLLATGRGPGAVSLMMQAIGRIYVRYVNRVFHRSGTLFEGRFKSSLVDEDRYLLTCMRYIELNPVRAGMVTQPGDFPWSSYAHNTAADALPWLTPAPGYLALGANKEERAAHYKALFAIPIAQADLRSIRTSLAACRGVGTESFIRGMERRVGHTVGVVPPGRPRREK